MERWPFVRQASRPYNGPMVSLTITLLGEPFANRCGDRMPICPSQQRVDIYADRWPTKLTTIFQWWANQDLLSGIAVTYSYNTFWAIHKQ